MLVTTYLVNLLCAVVECKGRMPHPEAYIAEYTAPPHGGSNIEGRKLGRSFNLETGGVNGDKFMGDQHYSSKRKMVFPLFNNVSNESSQSLVDNLNETAVSVLIQSGVNNVVDAIPNLLDSVSRIMQNGHSFDAGLNFRSGRKIDNEVRRNQYGDQLPMVFLKDGGGVEGYYMGTMNGRKISAYEGIPYAEPPIGNRRFKPPESIRPWKGIRKAQKPGSSCLQTHPLYLFRVTGSENCLFANVYSPMSCGCFNDADMVHAVVNKCYDFVVTRTENYDLFKPPSRNNGKLFPVLIFQHGGSFMYGSGSEYGPAYLLDHDVVLVTFNYRLGALGFLNTDDSTMSANNGLRDQALLIKWVHDNIRNFGGNPNLVTVSGQSAGGVSAHLHLIAGKVTNYFQNGISLSGSGFGFWPVLTKERSLRLTKSLAKRLNCPHRSSVELVRCLRGVSGSWITMTQLQLFDWIPFHPLVLFAPVVEQEGPGAYLTKWPEDAYANKEVERKPWIFGQTFKEGHFETYLLRLFMQTPNMALKIKKYLPLILDYDYFTSEPTTSQITDALMKRYEGDSSKLGLSMDTISDMYTDRFFSNTLHKAIHAHSRIAPTKTYAYIFDYVGKYNLGELFGVPPSEWSSAHTEDVMMMFNSSSFHHGLSKRDEEYGLSEIMTNMLSNFVATGKPYYVGENNKPNEVWENAVDFLDGMGPRIRYLRFGSSITMTDDPFHERVKFWEKLGIST